MLGFLDSTSCFHRILLYSEWDLKANPWQKKHNDEGLILSYTAQVFVGAIFWIRRPTTWHLASPPSVKVPVLSLQITEAEPKVSTAAILRTWRYTRECGNGKPVKTLMMGISIVQPDFKRNIVAVWTDQNIWREMRYRCKLISTYINYDYIHNPAPKPIGWRLDHRHTCILFIDSSSVASYKDPLHILTPQCILGLDVLVHHFFASNRQRDGHT